MMMMIIEYMDNIDPRRKSQIDSEKVAITIFLPTSNLGGMTFTS